MSSDAKAFLIALAIIAFTIHEIAWIIGLYEAGRP
jgi:hypothetical protein